MPTHDPSDIPFWSYLVSVLQVLGALGLLILGWLWSRLNRSQDELLRAHIRITGVEKALMQHQAEISKEYPTRSEVRIILEDVTKPIKDSTERTESMLNDLYRFHLHKRREDD